MTSQEPGETWKNPQRIAPFDVSPRRGIEAVIAFPMIDFFLQSRTIDERQVGPPKNLGRVNELLQ